jgi:hypothetical protein
MRARLREEATEVILRLALFWGAGRLAAPLPVWEVAISFATSIS